MIVFFVLVLVACFALGGVVGTLFSEAIDLITSTVRGTWRLLAAFWRTCVTSVK